MQKKDTHILSKGRKKILLLGMGLSLMLLVGGLYLSSGVKINTDQMPPTIEIDFNDETLYQGLSKIEDDRFIRYSSDDEDLSEDSSRFNNAKTQDGGGIRFFHVDEKTSLTEIFGDPIDEDLDELGYIEPDQKNKFVFATYRPEDKVWYIYPEGPFKTKNSDGDEVVRYIEDPDRFYVYPGEGFVIAAQDDFESIELKNAKKDPRKVHFDMDDLENGWNLLVVEDNESFQKTYDDCRNRILSVWVQNGKNSFEKADDRFHPELQNGYNMVWFLIGPEKNKCIKYDADAGDELECDDVSICDDDGYLWTDSCDVEAYDVVESEFFTEVNGACEAVTNYVPGDRPDICNPLWDLAICTSDGNWYKNPCLAYLAEPDFEIGLNYTATDDETCVEDPDPDSMPDICDPSYDPICAIDSSGSVFWFQNECLLNEINPEYVISDEYIASINEELCFLPYESTPRPEICNPLLHDPVCTVDGVLYNNECEAVLNEGADVEFTDMSVCLPDTNPDDCVRIRVCDVDGNFYGSSCLIDDSVVLDQLGKYNVDYDYGNGVWVCREISTGGVLDDYTPTMPDDDDTPSGIVDDYTPDLPDDALSDVCDEDTPVCSTTGKYYDNICELKEAGEAEDDGSHFSPSSKTNVCFRNADISDGLDLDLDLLKPDDTVDGTVKPGGITKPGGVNTDDTVDVEVGGGGLPIDTVDETDPLLDGSPDIGGGLIDQEIPSCEKYLFISSNYSTLGDFELALDQAFSNNPVCKEDVMVNGFTNPTDSLNEFLYNHEDPGCCMHFCPNTDMLVNFINYDGLSFSEAIEIVYPENTNGYECNQAIYNSGVYSDENTPTKEGFDSLLDDLDVMRTCCMINYMD